MTRFEGGEFVRLLSDETDEDFRAGDCGVVWGVYAMDPPFYEGTFLNAAGDCWDVMFTEEEVEPISEAQLGAHREQLLEYHNVYSGKIRKPLDES